MKQLSTQEKRTIVEKAFAVAEEGLVDETVSLFKEVEGQIGDSVAPYIGIALALIHNEKYDRAKFILEEGLTRSPDSQELKAYLAIVLHFLGDTAGKSAMVSGYCSEKSDVGEVSRALMQLEEENIL